MSNEFPVTGYFTNADALFTAQLCVDSQQKYFVPILAVNLFPFEIVLKVLKAVCEKNHAASRGYSFFEEYYRDSFRKLHDKAYREFQHRPEE